MSQPTRNSTNPQALACSIIIPTRDRLDFLQPCIDSILRTLGGLSVEIIVVDNGSIEEATIDYLAALVADPRCRVIAWNKPFNFSAINNYAAEQSRGEVLCFLNNDIEVIDKSWLETLLPIASRTDVGAVGCTLLYPDMTIQHGGIALHGKAVARHIAAHAAADFFSSQGITRPFAVDAVTAACMFIRRELFLRLGGFNETKLAVAFNDVDLCLRLGEKGLPVLLHPAVTLIHHESVSRKSDDLPSNRARAEKEQAFMHFRWQHRLAGQRYRDGLPEFVKRAAWSNGAVDGAAGGVTDEAAGGVTREGQSLDEIIATATANIYSGRFTDVDPLAAFEEDADAIANYWQQHYETMREDIENLKAHALRMEQAHALIENSIFWRMTAPLRWLKRTLSREGHRPPALLVGELQDPENEDNVYSSAVPQKTAPGNARKPADDPGKASYDYSAKKKLTAFLQAGNTLEFPEVQQPVISIILVFYNQAHLSLLCLQSILEHADVPCEVVIVDNNSTDATAELLPRLHHTTIIRNNDNIGFVKAVNQAAQQCRGEYLLLLNNDALLEPEALSSALAVFDEVPDTGAVGAMIKMLDGKLQEAGSIIWSDGACLGYGRGASPLQGEFRYRRAVDYCSGAFLLFSRQVYAGLDGFDEAYAPAYYEESDFCIRLQKRGLRVIYNPASQITHYEFASSGGIEGATRLQLAHRQLLCERHADFLAGKFPNDPANILRARTSNQFPNVLVIDDRVPYPSLGAGYPRAANLLNKLAAMDLNVSFYPLLFPEDDWNNIYDLLSPNIEVVLNHGKPELKKFLQERQGFYQYILISRCHNMEYFNFVVNLVPDVIRDARIIYDAEAVTAPRDFLRQQILGASLSESEQQAQLKKELEQARIADSVLTVSAREAAFFQQLNFNNTVVIGHTIAPTPTATPFAERSGLLFVGALRDDGSPNVDSLLWFIINVLPLIQQRIPDIQLHVVGDNSAPSLATIEVDAVHFRGRMGSIDSLYDSCRVFIAPTRFAAGIPHKVHEAAAKGIPSVTTTLLAVQLGWQDETQLLVADAAKDYAEQCLRLYQDGQLWERIRSNALEAIATDCSVAQFDETLAKLFQQN